MLMRAAERMPQQPDAAANDANTADDAPDAPEWKLAHHTTPHHTVDVTGNHQTMTNEHAASTAATLHQWLLDLDGP
ncbi:hypothetical protein [Candidatus Frankia alpina]|uniref:hypothetical protein n=1 Tax=Candidatus Frankia alpina TaxID=2699483 RepID=UPI0030135661